MSFLPTAGSGPKRDQQMAIFASTIKRISHQIDFKVSSRGWCYLLEGQNLINKGQFDRTQKLINECRKNGLLPIDLVAENEARSFLGLGNWAARPETRSPIDYFKDYVRTASDAAEYYHADWWKDEEYYVEMLVEKIDLVSLFQPICQEYHIPIATSRGSSDILQRAEMAWRFQWAEGKGLHPLLLYGGDFDPWGLNISDVLRDNFVQIAQGTGWWPGGLKIDRFCLNFDYIEANNLTWIDNLISGSGRDMSENQSPIAQDYISSYGVRKCEANALVVNPEAARTLCRETIEGYLGDDALARFEAKRQAIRDIIDPFKEQTGADEVFDKILETDEDKDDKDEPPEGEDKEGGDNE